MAIEKVKEYFKKFGKENEILEFDESSATVKLAAERLNCEEGMICKSITFNLIVARIPLPQAHYAVLR